MDSVPEGGPIMQYGDAIFDMTDLSFNMNNGYFEGIVRGCRAGILKHADYMNLVQCENLDDMKLHLATTDYGNFLQNEPSPLAVSVIDDKLKAKMVQEFNHIRAQSVEPLSTFLDFITYGYMIDNIVLMITGTLHGRETHELLRKCHPLGMMQEMPAVSIAATSADLYRMVIVETPLAPFFADSVSEHDLDDQDIEVVRNKVYKCYLEAFYAFCEGLGGSTAEAMCDILAFEADRRCFNIKINSFDQQSIESDVVAKLFPTCGLLYPDGLRMLAVANDYADVQRVADYYPKYKSFFDAVGGGASEQTLDDKFFQYEVHLNKMSFERQMHYGIFYSLIKLKEQEARNIVWISECIAQRNKSKIDNYIPIF